MKMYLTKALLSCTLLALFSLTACQTKTKQYHQAAIITSPSDQITKELNRVISKLLKDTTIHIHQDAFTKSSSITIVRKPHRTLEQQTLVGRVVENPIRISLVKNSQGCFLINQTTQEKLKLVHTKCSPE